MGYVPVSISCMSVSKGFPVKPRSGVTAKWRVRSAPREAGSVGMGKDGVSCAMRGNGRGGSWWRVGGRLVRACCGAGAVRSTQRVFDVGRTVTLTAVISPVGCVPMVREEYSVPSIFSSSASMLTCAVPAGNVTVRVSDHPCAVMSPCGSLNLPETAKEISASQEKRELSGASAVPSFWRVAVPVTRYMRYV